MPWDLSVPDWEERIREGRSLLPAMPDLDRGRADRAIKIFNKLRLPDVPGAPALAEAGGEWFREIVGALHARKASICPHNQAFWKSQVTSQDPSDAQTICPTLAPIQLPDVARCGRPRS